MASPSADELRALAQEIAADTDNDLIISGVADRLIKDDGVKQAKYYLHGFLTACMEDDSIPAAKLGAYLKVLALSEDELRRLARKGRS